MPKTSSRTAKTSSAPSSRSKSGSAAPRKGSSARSPRGTRKKSAPPAPEFRLPALSLDRKLDILGIIAVLTGFLILLSLLSSERGVLFSWIIVALNKIAGWGAFVLPIALVAGGLWLVFRKIEKMPQISIERVIGFTLLYLNLLVWMHFFTNGDWVTAESGQGGGYIGMFFLNLLITTMGKPGAVVLLLAWWIIASVFAFDLDLTALVRQIQNNAAQPQSGNRPASASPRAAHSAQPLLEDEPAFSAGEAPGEMPSDFRPLPDKPNGGRRSRHPEKAGDPAAEAAEAAAQTPGSAAPQPAAGADKTAPPATLTPAVVLPWKLPQIEQILDPVTPFAQQSNLDQDRAKLIEDTLASFGAPAHVVDISRGPTITRFGVEPDFIESRSGKMRVRVSKIASLSDDLALALAAPRIRIQAPVPGRSYVGIEVPNTEVSRVAMREVLESDGFKKIKSPLRFTLGKDVAGKAVSSDLAAMPHMLIAGTTGSGKSVCVNSILISLLLNNTPADLRLILVDPKRVELTGYNGIPHLLSPVVTDAERVLGALQWLQREMDARYHRFSQVGSRNIQDYNKRGGERLPYLVAVIDELADLMMVSPDETERAITRLAQLARATGIHLILATQRPSVDVVTGLIKANFPARVAFAVASGMDSRVILDQPGAERLLGRGDMLFQAPDAPAPVRLQGVYVSDVEIQRLVDYWHVQSSEVRAQAPDSAQPNTIPVSEMIPGGIPLIQGELFETDKGGDALMDEAIDLVRREGRASITMLQRRLRIGYTRAARLVDAMEEKGIISPALPNSQVREILDYGPVSPPADDGY